jgi:hypothetical protein
MAMGDDFTLGWLVADWIEAHHAPLDAEQLADLIGRARVADQRVTGDLAAEAALGAPVRFAGFADGGEVYDCSEHGCGCGWAYAYMAVEPMGVPVG